MESSRHEVLQTTSEFAIATTPGYGLFYFSGNASDGNNSNTITVNATDAGVEVQEHSLSAILVPIFFGVIFCVGIVGNSLVITVMLKIYRYQPQGLNNTNRFILNLAIADLFFLVFCVPFQAPVYSMDAWPFGGFMCVFCEVCQKVAMLASIYTLVALSFDRFFAVVYATSAKQLRTRANATRGLVFIWVISVGIGILAVVTRVEFEYEGLTLCLINWNMYEWYRWYQLSIFLLGYVLPLLVILSCYVGVLCAMCRNAKSNSAIMRNKSARGSRKRVTKIVVMVVIVFAIDWFPHHLTTLWQTFGNFPFTSATFVLKMVAHCLSYANSCVNPLVYAFVSQRFRSDFKRAFTCRDLTDAVLSMKAYSRRMVRSLSVHLRTSRGSSQTQAGGVVQHEVLQPRPPTITASSSSREYASSDRVRYGRGSDPMTSVIVLTPTLTNKNLSKTFTAALETESDLADSANGDILLAPIHDEGEEDVDDFHQRLSLLDYEEDADGQEDTSEREAIAVSCV